MIIGHRTNFAHFQYIPMHTPGAQTATPCQVVRPFKLDHPRTEAAHRSQRDRAQWQDCARSAPAQPCQGPGMLGVHCLKALPSVQWPPSSAHASHSKGKKWRVPGACKGRLSRRISEKCHRGVTHDIHNMWPGTRSSADLLAMGNDCEFRAVCPCQQNVKAGAELGCHTPCRPAPTIWWRARPGR